MAGLEEALGRHDRIGIDTSVFIYHLEESEKYAELVGLVFARLNRGAFDGITSVITLMELAVRPLQLGRADIADEYDGVLSTYPHLAVVDLDRLAARRAAELRAAYRLRPADALQVAACLEHRATAFLTNDRDLRRVVEMPTLLLDDFVGT